MKRDWLNWAVLMVAILAGPAWAQTRPATHATTADSAAAQAKRTLTARIEALRKAGEPLYPHDLQPPAIPDADNAVTDLRAAAAAVKADSEAWKQINGADLKLPLTDPEVQSLATVVKENADALRLVRQATTKPAVDWGVKYQTPLISGVLPNLNKQRQLAQLLGAAALDAVHRGRHDEALARVSDVLFISRAIDRQPSLISHLVAIGINALAIDKLTQLAPDLKIGQADGAVPPRQAQAMIAALLDDKPLHDGLVNALRGERAMQVDAIVAIAENKLDLETVTGQRDRQDRWGFFGKWATQLATPQSLLYEEAQFGLDQMTRIVDAARDAQALPEFTSAAPGIELDRELQTMRHPLVRILMPSFSRFVQTHFRMVAHRRLAATALAVRCYAADHDGKLPAKLDDLVPQYLPAVPADPLAANQPLKYKPDANNPILYSTGFDATDDGGSQEKAPPRQSWGPTDTRDFVLPLTPQSREPAKEEPEP